MRPQANPVLLVRDGIDRDAFAVTSVLTNVCVGTGFSRGLSDEVNRRHAFVQEYISGLFTEALASGSVRVAEVEGEVVGAALWTIRQARDAPSARPQIACHGGPVAGRRLDQVEMLAEIRCPPTLSYHRLRYLGVRSDWQGRGVGSHLLINHHALLHVAEIPAMAVVDGWSRPWFERHGYSAVGPAQTTADGVPLSVMWRDPVPADPLF